MYTLRDFFFKKRLVVKKCTKYNLKRKRGKQVYTFLFASLGFSLIIIKYVHFQQRDEKI